MVALVAKRRQWHPTPVLLPGKSHGRRGLVGCSPWGRQESDTTEQLHFIFSLSCIGEGNGNPLQCSCLENPRDRRAWWAAIYGVTQSQTWLKQLSSSSGKEPACQCRKCKRHRFNPWAGKIPRGGHGNLLQYSWLENLKDRSNHWEPFRKQSH